MKKDILASLSVLLFMTTTVLAEHHEVGGKPTQIGIQITDDGKSIPLVAGSLSNIKIWQDYIQAHNDRDFDKIAGMNADGFNGQVPTGEIVSSSESQRKFLERWIEESNPTWQVIWIIANDGENPTGVMEEWLATGQMVTSTDAEGKEISEYHSIDVKLEAGKIAQVFVAAMSEPTE